VVDSISIWLRSVQLHSISFFRWWRRIGSSAAFERRQTGTAFIVGLFSLVSFFLLLLAYILCRVPFEARRGEATVQFLAKSIA
jgi:hypothetical protein